MQSSNNIINSFSLFELLHVGAIIAILAGVGTVGYTTSKITVSIDANY